MFSELDAAASAAAELRRQGITDNPRAPRWNRDVRSPQLRLPPGACDSHLHVIGPQAIFPVQESPFSFVTLDDSTLDDWHAVRDALGFTRGVHVQSMNYGNSYHLMLHTLSKAPETLRGVAAVWPEITDRELEILDRAGVVGARFSYTTHKQIDEGLVARLTDLGWSINYSVDPNAGPEWRERILKRPGRFVLEHIGMSPAEFGVDGPQFRFVLECLDTGRCWVKLSHRPSSQDTPPFSDLLPLIHRVLERAPDRALWGSDWPHIPYFRPMPNEADFLDVTMDWITDSALLQKVFVDNPAELFDWPYVADPAARSTADC